MVGPFDSEAVANIVISIGGTTGSYLLLAARMNIEVTNEKKGVHRETFVSIRWMVLFPFVLFSLYKTPATISIALLVFSNMSLKQISPILFIEIFIRKALILNS